MRKFISTFFICLIFMYCIPASADEYYIDTNLVYPSPQSWINYEDCTTSPEDLYIQLSWSLPNPSIATWEREEKADVFLSLSDVCSSKDIQIGDTEDTDIDLLQQNGTYPVDQEDLTLADLIADTEIDCDSGQENDYYLCIEWDWEYINYDYGCYGGALIRIDFKPPSAPIIVSVSPGETNLKVTWESPDDDDLGGFKIYYRPEGASDFETKTETDKTKTRSTITGLINYTSYEVWIEAVDEAENTSASSESMFGTPMLVEDFFELYKNSGGAEQGGYCFVATAAYGSYQNGMVRYLRDFRDRVLAHNPTGRSLIKSYYQYGPLWARALHDSDTAKSLTRFWLLPLIGFARLCQEIGPWSAGMLMLLFPVFVAMFMVFLARRRHPRFIRHGVSFLLIVGCLFIQLPKAHASEESNYQLQMRFGFYYPSVDDEAYPDMSEGSDKPFQSIFGSDGKFMFELGVDYQIWKGFGTLTAGGTFGFVQYLGKALTEEGLESSDTTVFNIVPLRLTIGYHFDYLEKNMGVPLVPYVCGGISYYLWWVLDGVGDVTQWTNTAGEEFDASGGIFGYHFAVGLKFLLDVIEPEAAANLAADVGVYNTFLFGEYTISKVDGFGSENHMNLGDEAFMFGLMMEF